MNVPLSESAEQPLSLRPPQYHSYLLRFWEERGQQPSVWRFSLEDPQTDQRYGFASLEALMHWLRAALNETQQTERP
ncbi:hypothetical protein TFLX_01718 [Thermoflexales bacterium]|nr:hypothetical protein TFLX_01718 [Thermoflexales bacterium]